MKEHPILFSTEMVRAILNGRKTTTRRIVKPQPDDDGLWNDTDHPRSLQSTLKGWNGSTENGESKEWKCPYGNVGDLLWARETFEVYLCNDGGEDYTQIRFISDGRMIRLNTSLSPNKHPSIHMPKDAAQIWLEVKHVKVERLQDITEEDARAEGTIPFPDTRMDCWTDGRCKTAFEFLWNQINGWDPNAWELNPFVWVIRFKVLSTTGKHLAVVEETNEA